MEKNPGFLSHLGPKYLLIAVKAMIEDGSNEQALVNCEEILKLHPDDLDTLEILKNLYDKLGDKKKMKHCAQRIQSLKKKASSKVALKLKKKSPRKRTK